MSNELPLCVQELFSAPKTIDDLVERLRGPTPFSTANYGDGEWSCILGGVGSHINHREYNVNGDQYALPGLAEAMVDTLLEPVLTYYGYNPGKKLRGRVENWLRERGINVPVIGSVCYEYGSGRSYKSCKGLLCHGWSTNTRVPWMWKEIISGANCKGEFAPFLRLCKESAVIVVGGAHLSNIPDFDYSFIETPSSNTWNEIDSIEKKVLLGIKSIRPQLVLFCCGLASNILIWRLAKRGVGCHLVDCGAVFDPYVGVKSRKTYKGVGFQKRLFRNRTEAIDGGRKAD